MSKQQLLNKIQQSVKSCIATMDKALPIIATMDADGKNKRWITTETGSHILVDGDGNIMGGAGGKFNGKPLSAMGGTKKFTKYETNAERAGKEQTVKNLEKSLQQDINEVIETIKKHGRLHEESQKQGQAFIDKHGQQAFNDKLIPALKSLKSEKWYISHIPNPYGGKGVDYLTKFYKQDNKEGSVHVDAYFDNNKDANSKNIENAKRFIIRGHYSDSYRLENVTEKQLNNIANSISKFRADNPKSSSLDEIAFIKTLGFKKDDYGNLTYNGQQPATPATPATQQGKQGAESKQEKSVEMLN